MPLKNRLLNFFAVNDVLDKNQYQSNEITKAIDGTDDSVLIFCDLSKAFDSVNHCLLFEKLHYYDARERSHNLFESYLNNKRRSCFWE